MRISLVLGASLSAALAVIGCDSGKPPNAAPTPGMEGTEGSTSISTTPPSAAPTTPESPSATPSQSASTTPTPTQAPSSAPTQPSNGDSRWIGTWTSPSCGSRTYERRITLKTDKTFTAQDLVSPCPPKVQCVWAGIVGFSGDWTLDDKGAVLRKTSGAADPTKKSKTDAPIRLTFDKASSSPAEVSDTGAACVYTRVAEGSGR